MYEGYGVPIFYRSFDTLLSRILIEDFEKGRPDFNFEDSSDIAIHLSHLERFEEGLELMKIIYKSHPDEYGVVANLGTFYELNGELDSAHYYIKKSIDINKDAHQGSEWVHLKILRAKMAIEKDPDWILSHNVLDLKFNREPNDNDYDDNGLDIDYELSQVMWQMVERIPFTPEKDLLIANIFKAAGSSYEQTISMKDGFICYQIAMQYDPEDQLNIIPLYEDLKQIIDTSSSVHHSSLDNYFKPRIEFDESDRSYSDVWEAYAIENGLMTKVFYDKNGSILDKFSMSPILITCTISITLLVLVLVIIGKVRKKKKT